MTWSGWAEIALILVIVGASAPPLAAYMARVFAGERTPLSLVIAPVERGFYAAAGVDPAKVITHPHCDFRGVRRRWR